MKKKQDKKCVYIHPQYNHKYENNLYIFVIHRKNMEYMKMLAVVISG